MFDSEKPSLNFHLPKCCTIVTINLQLAMASVTSHTCAPHTVNTQPLVLKIYTHHDTHTYVCIYVNILNLNYVQDWLLQVHQGWIQDFSGEGPSQAETSDVQS